MNKKFSIIVAMSKNKGIGLNNKLPWNNITNDINFFKNKTTNVINPSKINAIIMGRKTWESLPIKPLKNRLNLVLSTNPSYNFNNFNDILNYCNNNNKIENIYVIGGSKVYEKALYHDLCEKLYINEIKGNYNCDTFFPKIPENFILKNIKSDKNIIYKEYIINKSSETEVVEEYQYLNLIKNILKNGIIKNSRNGKVISIFGGINHSFDLNNGFPILTTKKMFFKAIVEELLFFIRGDTDSKILEKKGINIWKKNTNKEFLKSRNLNYEIGDMGPMYGFIWRHFGINYYNGKKKYNGYDQLKNLLEQLENFPNSRRLLLTSYEPNKIIDSVLPPCHGLIIQFNVRNQYLDCQMYQRSADIGLGYPFNITSYSLLLFLISLINGYKPGKLFICLGDAHIYENHIEKLKEQIKRIPYEKPSLVMKKTFDINLNNNVNSKIQFLENLTYEDFKLKNYNFHESIKMDMIP